MSRVRLLAAGMVAFLLGVPLTEKVFGATADIVDASVNLATAIAQSAGDS